MAAKHHAAGGKQQTPSQPANKSILIQKWGGYHCRCVEQLQLKQIRGVIVTRKTSSSADAHTHTFIAAAHSALNTMAKRNLILRQYVLLMLIAWCKWWIWGVSRAWWIRPWLHRHYTPVCVVHSQLCRLLAAQTARFFMASISWLAGWIHEWWMVEKEAEGSFRETLCQAPRVLPAVLEGVASFKAYQKWTCGWVLFFFVYGGGNGG